MNFTKHTKGGGGFQSNTSRTTKMGLLTLDERTFIDLGSPRALILHISDDGKSWAIEPSNNKQAGYTVRRYAKAKAHTCSIRKFLVKYNIPVGDYRPTKINGRELFLMKPTS